MLVVSEELELVPEDALPPSGGGGGGPIFWSLLSRADQASWAAVASPDSRADPMAEKSVLNDSLPVSEEALRSCIFSCMVLKSFWAAVRSPDEMSSPSWSMST